MTIRKAEHSDAVKLYALEQELFSKENFPLSRKSFAYHIKHNLLYVVEIDAEIAGYILVLIRYTNAKLYSVGIDQKHRGKKIAGILFETVSEKLIDLGFKKMLLEVRVDNHVAINLYKKEGFEIIKTLSNFYLDGCDAYLMELEYQKEK